MKLPLRPLKRVVALTTAVVVVAGAAAGADTSSIGVGVGVVNGMRTLHVTGTDFAGSTNLAFRNGTFSSPFGVMVNDIAYSRAGYDVTAILSDLYRLDGSTDDGYDCTSLIASKDLSLRFPTAAGDPTGTAAFVEPIMDWAGAFTVQNVIEAGLIDSLDLVELDLLATDVLTVTVADIQGLLDEALYGSLLMQVSNGENTASDFTAPASHACAGDAVSPTSRNLQRGATVEPTQTQLDELTSTTFATAAGIDEILTVAEGTVPDGLLDGGADEEGGILWDPAQTAILGALAGAGITFDDVTEATVAAALDTLTTNVIADLTGGLADFTLAVVGQNGNYRNLPILDLAETAVADVPTGLYHGVMTVTLSDR